MTTPDQETKLDWLAHHFADPTKGDTIGAVFDHAEIDARNGWTVEHLLPTSEQWQPLRVTQAP